MMPLNDMLTQNGKGMELLARQFNLSQQQAQLAVEALLPAFSQGLKRNTSDPHGLGAFMSAMASGGHAKYFEDAQNAFSPQGVADGNGILGHLFGSKDLSRAVASQAAQATGIGQQVLQQMMPAIAAMIMGGLFKQSTSPMQASQAAGNPLGDIIEQIMRQGGAMMGGAAQPSGAREQSASPFDNPFGKVLEGMFGGGQKAPDSQAAPKSQNPFGDNPFGKIFEDMLGGGRSAEPQAEPAQRQGSAPKPDAPAKNPYEDIFGKMFETGAKQRDDYQKGVESIFDQFSRGMDRHK